MKQSPELQQIQDNMRTGALAVYCFLGDDTRNLIDIISRDRQVLDQLGVTTEELAQRMEELARYGREKPGIPVVVDGIFQVTVEEHKGSIPCPFRDRYSAPKRDVTVINLHLEERVRWSDLNVHLLAAHGFFEGEGAPYRLEPEQLAKVLGLI